MFFLHSLYLLIGAYLHQGSPILVLKGYNAPNLNEWLIVTQEDQDWTPLLYNMFGSE